MTTHHYDQVRADALYHAERAAYLRRPQAIRRSRLCRLIARLDDLNRLASAVEDSLIFWKITGVVLVVGYIAFFVDYLR